MITCRFRPDLGRYLVGLLDPAERAAFEEHLGACSACRTELAAMAPLPGLIRHLPLESPGTGTQGLGLDDGGNAVACPDLDAELPGLAAAGSKPPRRGATWSRAVQAAGALSAAAGLTTAAVLLAVHAGRPSGPAAQTVSATSAATGVSATATMTPEPTGTLLTVRVHGLPPGVVCRLVVTGRDTAPQTAADWASGYATDATVEGTSSVAPSDITHLDIITTQGNPLVSLPGP